MERLQRVMAARGTGSRRAAEELITAGHVTVNGEPVTELGTRVDPATAEIRVDGKLLRPQRPRTILLNKPAGFITTVSDERGRRTVMELVHVPERVFPVGRLDRDTEGLLLLTNDGDIANRVMHPRYGLAKEYQVLTLSRPSDQALQRIRKGVVVEGQTVVPEEFRILRQTRQGLILKVVVHQGIYHVVRRMMESVGIPVQGLRRTRIGPLSVEGIAPGAWRDASPGEMGQLLQALHLEDDPEVAATSHPGWRQTRRHARVRPSLARRQDDTQPESKPDRETERDARPRRRSRPHQPTSGKRRNDTEVRQHQYDRGRSVGYVVVEGETPAGAKRKRNEDSDARRSETGTAPTAPSRTVRRDEKVGERPSRATPQPRSKRTSNPRPEPDRDPSGSSPRDRDRRGGGGRKNIGGSRTGRPPRRDAV